MRSPFRLFAGATVALWAWTVFRFWLHVRQVPADVPHWCRQDITIPASLTLVLAVWVAGRQVRAVRH